MRHLLPYYRFSHSAMVSMFLTPSVCFLFLKSLLRFERFVWIEVKFTREVNWMKLSFRSNCGWAEPRSQFHQARNDEVDLWKGRLLIQRIGNFKSCSKGSIEFHFEPTAHAHLANNNYKIKRIIRFTFNNREIARILRLIIIKWDAFYV